MKKRTGKHGDFMYCPRQQTCGQKTITVTVTGRLKGNNYPVQTELFKYAALYEKQPVVREDRTLANIDFMELEARVIASEMSILSTAPSVAFPNWEDAYDSEVDDPMFDDGSDWRPY